MKARPGRIRPLKITSRDKSGLAAHCTEIRTTGRRSMNRQARSWLQFDKPSTSPRDEVCRPLGVCEPQALWNAVVRGHGLSRREAGTRGAWRG